MLSEFFIVTKPSTYVLPVSYIHRVSTLFRSLHHRCHPLSSGFSGFPASFVSCCTLQHCTCQVCVQYCIPLVCPSSAVSHRVKPVRRNISFSINILPSAGPPAVCRVDRVCGVSRPRLDDQSEVAVHVRDPGAIRHPLSHEDVAESFLVSNFHRNCNGVADGSSRMCPSSRLHALRVSKFFVSFSSG